MIRRRAWTSNLLLAFLFNNGWLSGQAKSLIDRFHTYSTEARDAYLEKDYTRAQQLYLLALREAGGINAVNARVAETLDSLCIVYNAQKRHSETESLYLRSLAIREELFGADSLEVAEGLSRIAACYSSLGRLEDSVRAQTRAVSIVEQVDGPQHEHLAYRLQQLGRYLNLDRRHIDAEIAATRALAILEAKFGPDHPNLAGTLTLLGAVYSYQERFGEAEAEYIRALKLRGSTTSIVMLVFDLNNLALLYRKTGKYGDAERLYHISLKELQERYGSEHPCLLPTLQYYTMLLKMAHRPSEARAVSERIAHILERSNGDTACRP
jgi:tetratricopeptide (TPR) repeat protein